MYICLCKGITESDAFQLAGPACATPEALMTALGLDDDECCGHCSGEIDELLRLVTKARGSQGRQPVGG